MSDDGFIIAVDPQGNKRRVPEHYLDNPAFGFKLPPSARAEDPDESETVTRVEEPAASATSKKVTEPAAAGETKEVRS